MNPRQQNEPEGSSHEPAGESDETTGTTLLRTEGLTREFGSFVAVDEVDLSVPRGETHSIIGPNGAGKTTLFNLLTGTLSPTAGRVVFDGVDITDEPVDARARRGISRVYQITQVFEDLTTLENMETARRAIAQSFNPVAAPDPAVKDRSRAMLERLELSVGPDTPARELSHGAKKKLEIGMSLVAEPELLLLDEPTSGMSQSDSKRIVEFLDRVTEGLTVLLIEHDVDLVLELSDRITVLQAGGVIARGTSDTITTNERVQQAYLGDTYGARGN